MFPASEGSGIPSVIFLAYVKFLAGSVIFLDGTLNISSATLPEYLSVISLNVSPLFTLTILFISLTLSAILPILSTFVRGV